MSVTVKFYTFSKKENSTAQPLITDLVATETCVMKAPTDLIRPVLLLEYSGSPAAMNYAQISDFGRYYFVETWTNINAAQWQVSLREDYLATWKTQIGNASKYILRCATNTYWDGNITDTLYPTKGNATVYNNSLSTSFYSNTGTYICGILGEDPSGNNTGPVTYYAFTESQMAAFVNYLLGTTNWLNINPGELSADLLKTLFNPMQYIVSMKWFPLTLPTASPFDINFAWWTIHYYDVAASIVTARDYQTPTYTITIPKHWQAATRGNYLNYAPYSRYTLDAGVFGSIPLDSLDLAGYSSLYLTISNVDIVSGDASLDIEVDGGTKLLTRVFSNIAVDIPVGQITSDVIGAFSSAVGTVAGTAASIASHNIGGAITNLISGITSTVEACLPQVSVSGHAGSRASLIKPMLISRFVDVVAADDTELGRPCCQQLTINSLSGYVLCADGEVAIAGYPEERKAIESFLTSGFFYD